MRRLTRAVLSIAVPTICGIAAAFYTPLSFWLDIKEGLIAFLGLIIASLMQVMPMTANFIQSDTLKPEEARRLIKSLTRQQYYWIGLLSATIATLLVIIISSAISLYLGKLTEEWHGLNYSSIPCFLIASSLSFVLIKMTGLFEGMLSLHNLRAELVISAANRSAKEKKDLIQASAGELACELPDGYGKIVDQP